MDDQVGNPFPRLLLEGVDPEALSIDVDEGVGDDHLLGLAPALLSRTALQPERCRLVVAGDFVGSVQTRLDSTSGEQGFGVQRGTGFVGGKTLVLADGSIDVVISAALAVMAIDPEGPEGAARLLLRTVEHEAQHVAMDQAEEGVVDLSGYGLARANFVASAASIIEEYRAELGVERALFPDSQVEDLPQAVQEWREELVRIAAVEYQQHHDVDRLWRGVVEVSVIAWKVLAYAAAEFRAASDIAPNVDEDVSSNSDWSSMVQGYWPHFVSLLHEVPPGNVRISAAALGDSIHAMADLLDSWLRSLGFQFTDESSGSRFVITDWSLMCTE